MAILFAPFFALFTGQAATWPIKATMHLLAIGQVGLVYGIMRVLMKNGGLAFACGVIAALSPSLINYSNRLLSEIPSGFFILLATYASIRFLQDKKPLHLFIAMFSLSFSTLLRPENLLLFLIFAVAGYGAISTGRKEGMNSGRLLPIGSKYYLIGLVLAAIPLFMWSMRNYNQTGSFALTSYTDVALYDGWIDFARNYKIRIPVETSESMKEIERAWAAAKQAALEKESPWDERKVIGWNAYYDHEALRSMGLTKKEADRVMLTATLDFLRYYATAEPKVGLSLIRQKIENGIIQTLPIFWVDDTSPLPGEKGYLQRPAYPGNEISPIEKYISLDHSLAQPAILLQRWINRTYRDIFYNPSVSLILYYGGALGLLGLVTCLLLKPFPVGLLFSLFTFSKIVVPALISWAQLRLSLPGLFLYYMLCMIFFWQVVSFPFSRAYRK